MNEHYECRFKRDQFYTDIRKEANYEKINQRRAKITIENNIKKSSKSSLHDYKLDLELAYNLHQIDQVQNIVHEIRYYVSSSENQNDKTYKEFYEAELEKFFVLFISEHYDFSRSIQSEALWAWSNVSAADFGMIKHVIINTNFVDCLVRMLMSQDLEHLEHAMYILSNLVAQGEGLVLRDQLISNGYIDNLVTRLSEMLDYNAQSQTLRQTSTWFISNLLKGAPFPDASYLDPTYKNLANFCIKAIKIDDTEVIKECLWSIFYFATAHQDKKEQSYMRCEFLISHESFYKDMQMAYDQSQDKGPQLQKPIIEIILFVNFVQDQKAKDLQKYGICNQLLEGLHSITDIQVKCCRILFNMAAEKDEKEFPKIMLERDDLMKKLIEMLTTARESVKVELSWFFYNITYCAPVEILTNFLIKHKDRVFEAIQNSLDGMNNPEYQLKMIGTIRNLLRYGEKISKNEGSDTNLVQNEFLECGDQSLEHLNVLQYHKYEKVYQESTKLIEDYFPSDEMDD